MSSLHPAPSPRSSPSPRTATFEGATTNASDGHQAHDSRPASPQYATFRTPMSTPEKESVPDMHRPSESWTPTPLRPWFWIPLVCIMIGGGIGLEIAFHFSQKNHGWETGGPFTTEQGFMHYVYTFPPAAIALLFAGFWGWTDLEIRRLQPYVDLARGNSPPQHSLLLDYTRNHTAYVWSIAARNRHYLVTLSSLLVLATFCFQPLSAALFNVQDVWWTAPLSMTNSVTALGLNQNENFQDLTSFLTAAGYASADVLYDIGDPTFVDGRYSVAQFELPDIANGTVTVNTTIVESTPNCVGPDGSVNMVQLDAGVWNNTASFGGCTFEWSVSKNADHLFGANPIPESASANCTRFTSQPTQFRPVIFWFFTYVPVPAASVTLCSPTIALHFGSAAISLPSGNTSVATSSLVPITASSSSQPQQLQQQAQFAGNLTGDPLDARAYNGLFFPFAPTSDPFVQGRQTAVQLALPGAVFQAASQRAGGLEASFQGDIFAKLAEGVYTTYLALIARTVYFLPLPSSQGALQIPLQTQMTRQRLFLTPVATHLLAAILFVLGTLGTVLHLAHRHVRAVLHLPAAPGTIASAVSLGGQSGLGSVLAGRLGEVEMREALQNKRFRIDPETMKIVMEGQAGYEQAQSPHKVSFLQGKRLSLGNFLKRDTQ